MARDWFEELHEKVMADCEERERQHKQLTESYDRLSKTIGKGIDTAAQVLISLFTGQSWPPVQQRADSSHPTGTWMNEMFERFDQRAQAARTLRVSVDATEKEIKAAYADRLHELQHYKDRSGESQAERDRVAAELKQIITARNVMLRRTTR